MRQILLQQGDIILHDGNPCRVRGLCDYELGLVDEVTGQRCFLDITNGYDTIPLTSECLVRNGFFRSFSGVYSLSFLSGCIVYHAEGRRLVVTNRDAKGREYRTDIPVDTIDELQRALRSCRFFDIADSFRA